MQHRIAIIKLGHIDHLFNIKEISNWKSDLFTISGVYNIEYLPGSDICDGYLNVKYSDAKLDSLVSCPKDSDYAVAIMPYEFKDRFYLHRISKDCVVISLYGILDILKQDDISVEHFIIKQLYEVCAIRHLIGDLTNDNVYDYVHTDTRCCLFDLNGDRSDILYNTEQPILCEECKGEFKKKQLKPEISQVLERELRKIRKPLILRAERWIKKYPFISLILSVFSAIILNILANLLWEIIKKQG